MKNQDEGTAVFTIMQHFYKLFLKYLIYFKNKVAATQAGKGFNVLSPILRHIRYKYNYLYLYPPCRKRKLAPWYHAMASLTRLSERGIAEAEPVAKSGL